MVAVLVVEAVVVEILSVARQLQGETRRTIDVQQKIPLVKKESCNVPAGVPSVILAAS